MVWYLPLKLLGTEDGLTAGTDLAIQILLWNWHIFYPTSHRFKSTIREIYIIHNDVILKIAQTYASILH